MHRRGAESAELNLPFFFFLFLCGLSVSAVRLAIFSGSVPITRGNTGRDRGAGAKVGLGERITLGTCR